MKNKIDVQHAPTQMLEVIADGLTTRRGATKTDKAQRALEMLNGPVAKAVNCHECMLIALKQLALRFSFEWKTTTHPPNCTCNQFLDNGYCRHLDALAAISKAEGK